MIVIEGAFKTILHVKLVQFKLNLCGKYLGNSTGNFPIAGKKTERKIEKQFTGSFIDFSLLFFRNRKPRTILLMQSSHDI